MRLDLTFGMSSGKVWDSEIIREGQTLGPRMGYGRKI